MFLIINISILLIALSICLLVVCYFKYGWFKIICHDKLDIHIPDFDNVLYYDESSMIARTVCKYCNEELIYPNTCKYLVKNNPNEIPHKTSNLYCKECISKNYNHNGKCCPYTCDEFSSCNYCEKECFNI